jgi:hypothetical protein
MEFLPSELLINIIDNIWNLDTLIQLQLTNKVLYDCVNSSYSFNLLKECLNDKRWNYSYIRKSKKEKIYVISCMRGILGIVKEYSKEVDRDIILQGFRYTKKYNYLHILKWLKYNFNITDEEVTINNNFVSRVSLEWLRDCFNRNITEEERRITEEERRINNEAFREGMVNNHQKVLNYLRENFK